jgi:hypothetical protein
MVIIFSAEKSNRLTYTLETLMGALGLSFKQTNTPGDFVEFDGPKINYSKQPLATDECWIYPDELLFQTSIKEQPIVCIEWNQSKAFFKSSSGDLPFDMLAASFYLLSRYEEYLVHSLDEYGRYAHINSVAFQQGFLNIPLVNVWLQQLVSLLKTKFPQLNIKQQQFSFLPTYDIDIAWSYKGKGLLRNVGGSVHSLLTGKRALLIERLNVLTGKEADPFDVYDWLDELHLNYKLQPVYFFLLAQSSGKYDKNILATNSKFKWLIKRLAERYTVGIHPSWQSGDNGALLKTEMDLLGKTVNKQIVDSRQHYIRFSLPHTYQHLLKASIKNDYSMGYGSINGFRASYALPFKWYNLSTETSTDLTIFPFCFMDANSFFEQQLTAKQALQELEHYYNIVKHFNGTLVTIFHNHLLTKQPRHIEWRNLYEHFLKKHF